MDRKALAFFSKLKPIEIAKYGTNIICASSKDTHFLKIMREQLKNQTCLCHAHCNLSYLKDNLKVLMSHNQCRTEQILDPPCSFLLQLQNLALWTTFSVKDSSTNGIGTRYNNKNQYFLSSIVHRSTSQIQKQELHQYCLFSIWQHVLTGQCNNFCCL